MKHARIFFCSLSLLWAIHGCSSTPLNSQSSDAAAPLTAPSLPPPLSLEEAAIPLTPLPSGCPRSDGVRGTEDAEALLKKIQPAPKAMRRVTYECGYGNIVTAFLDYGSTEAANRAVYRFAGRVFHGSAPLPNIRYDEVLQRGPIVAVVAGGMRATEFAVRLRRDRLFEPALKDRTLTDAYNEPSKQGSFLLTVLSSSGIAAVDSGLFFEYPLKCRKPEANALFCDFLQQFSKLYPVPDPPRDEPRVLLGPCVDISVTPPKEDICWLLWGPLGVSLGSVSDVASAASLDDAARSAIRNAVAQGSPAPVPPSLREAVLDLGPGQPSVLKGGTRLAVVGEKRALHIRGDDKRLIVLEMRGNDEHLVASFVF